LGVRTRNSNGVLDRDKHVLLVERWLKTRLRKACMTPGNATNVQSPFPLTC
jgi:hypothetical protein